MSQNQAIKKLPGVLSFQRGLVISDGLFFDEINGSEVPLLAVRHGIRGSQNVNSPKGFEKDVSNIQTIDSAKKSADADAVIVRFDVRFLDIKDTLFACTGKDKEDTNNFKDSLYKFLDEAKGSPGMDQVALRYARNILNGRWLWRNRLIAQKIRIAVTSGNELLADVDNALNISLNHFNDVSDQEKAVAKVIADGLKGQSSRSLSVMARIDYGIKGQHEVFCSQNYIENKPSGFARSLYYVGKPEKATQEVSGMKFLGQAALRDQKVTNAIRTIDTWYPGYTLETHRPIAVEPLGANLTEQCFFRDKKSSAFALAKKLNDTDPASPDGMFMIAALIRGGVYSEADKKEA